MISLKDENSVEPSVSLYGMAKEKRERLGLDILGLAAEGRDIFNAYTANPCMTSGIKNYGAECDESIENRRHIKAFVVDDVGQKTTIEQTTCGRKIIKNEGEVPGIAFVHHQSDKAVRPYYNAFKTAYQVEIVEAMDKKRNNFIGAVVDPVEGASRQVEILQGNVLSENEIKSLKTSSKERSEKLLDSVDISDYFGKYKRALEAWSLNNEITLPKDCVKIVAYDPSEVMQLEDCF